MKLKKLLAGFILTLFSLAVMGQWYDFIGNLQFDIGLGVNPSHSEGMMFYDNTAKAVSYYNDDADVTVNLGQENMIQARNVTGADIDDGTPVFVSGSTGQTLNASLADSSFIETSITLGLWTSGTTAHNSFGYVTTFGNVNGLDTSSYTEGDVLYLDTVAGQLVVAPPRPPARLNILGIVTNSHATQGKIFVRPESLTRDVALHKNLITNFGGDAQFNPQLVNFTSGDSAIFGDSGTLTGTLATSVVTADQLLGTRVFKYTQIIGSGDDWIAFPQVTVPELVNTIDVLLAYNFRYKYDGDGGDFEVRARCVDDNSIILDSSSTLDPTKYRFSGEITVPKDCNEIIFGLHVLVENPSAVLLFDDIKISDEPREIKSLTNLTDWEPFTPTGTWVSGATYSGSKRRVGSNLEMNIKVSVTGAVTASELRIILPDGLGADANAMFLEEIDTKFGGAVYKDAGSGFRYQGSVTAHSNNTEFAITLLNDAGAYEGIQVVSNTIPVVPASGDEVHINFSVPIQGWSAQSSGTVHSVDLDDDDYNWTSYTPITTGLGTPANVSFKYRRVADSLHVVGSLTTGTTSATPASVSIPSGLNIDATKIGINSNNGSLSWEAGNFVQNNNNGGGEKLLVSSLTSTTQVWVGRGASALTPTASFSGEYSSGENSSFEFTVPIVGWSANPISQLIIENPDGEFGTAYINVTSPPSYFGSIVSTTSYKTRILNSLVGDSSIGSVASNQLTLKAGEYNLEIPVSGFDGSQWVSLQIYNITAAAIHETFTNVSYSDFAVSGFNSVKTTIKIASDTTFDFRTKADVAVGNEIIARIKIEKAGQELGVDVLKNVITNHVTGGTEYELKGQLEDGVQMVARTWIVGTDITVSNGSYITGLPTTLDLTNAVNARASLWTLSGYDNGTHGYEIYYDKGAGNIAIGIVGSWKVGAGTRITIKYPKP